MEIEILSASLWKDSSDDASFGHTPREHVPVDIETLMGMQSSYDIAQARKRKGAIQVERYQPEVHP